jgi:adenosylhomocysteine nucleosidase
MKRLGIIAALPGELRPLVQGWEQSAVGHGASYSQTQDGLETVAVYCGIGREPAARACMQAMEGGDLSALVSIGWAGALSPSVQTGIAYNVTDVVDAATGERYVTEDRGRVPEAIKLVTTRRVILRDEKRPLAEDYGAVVVDMEAATVARLARVRGIPFYCYKAVSDSVEESLPDMNPYVTTDGQVRMPQFVASLLVKPYYWPGLVRMGKNSSRGALALAGAVKKLQGEMRQGETIEDAYGS